MTASNHARLQMIVAATLVYIVAAAMVGQFAQEPVVATGALFDLVVTVPLLAVLLLVRRGLAKWGLPLLLAAAGMSAGLFLVPDSSLGDFAVWRQDAWVGLRHLMLGVIAARCLLAIDSLRHREDQPQPLAALRELTGSDKLARFLIQEGRVLVLGLTGWPRRPAGGGQVFTQHRTSGLLALLVTFSLLLMAETVGLHLLLARWEPMAAWTATLISLYALIWFVALYQSVRLQPVIVDRTGLTIGAGLRGRVEIGLDQIACLAPATTVNHQQEHYLRAAVITEPNLLLTLKYPVVAIDLSGRRKPVRLVGLYVDDPDGLRQAIKVAAAID